MEDIVVRRTVNYFPLEMPLQKRRLPLAVDTVLSNPTVVDVAQKHGVTAAQVALRWLVEQGIPVITSGSNLAHYKQDIAVTQFALGPADMARLSAEAMVDTRSTACAKEALSTVIGLSFWVGITRS